MRVPPVFAEPPPAPPGEVVVVSRDVRHHAASAEAVADALRSEGSTIAVPGGKLRLRAPFAPRGPSEAKTVSATGRLHHNGRLARSAAVDVDIVLWSDAAGELLIRPSRRQFIPPGRRRQERHFAVAHDVADRLADTLSGALTPSAAPIPLRLRERSAPVATYRWRVSA